MSKVSNKKWLVIGAGKSGYAAAGLLLNNDAQVILYDDNKDKTCTLENVVCAFGGIDDEMLDTVDMAIISPGISTESDIAQRCLKKGIEVIGEIELAYMFDKGCIAAITGTNGKTTTTTLLGEIMKTAYDNVIVAGNIGNPYTELAVLSDKKSCSVLELSSFQLETVKTFKPKVFGSLRARQSAHKIRTNYADRRGRRSLRVQTPTQVDRHMFCTNLRCGLPVVRRYGMGALGSCKPCYGKTATSL